MYSDRVEQKKTEISHKSCYSQACLKQHFPPIHSFFLLEYFNNFSLVFQRVVINTDDRYGTLATELIRFANSLFLLQLTPPGKSPISVQVESPGTLTVAANDWNKTVLNFAINITTKLSKKTLIFLDCIFIIKSQFSTFVLLIKDNKYE